MNELSDDDIRTALDAAGRGPTDASRLRMRAALLDERAEAPVVGVRRTGWIVGTALAAAAVLLVAIVLVHRDDDRRIQVGLPPDTEVLTPSVDSTMPTSSVVADVSGRRWTLESMDDEPWTNAVVPFLDPVVTGGTWVATGWSGCNEIGLSGTVADDALVIDNLETTAAPCTEVRELAGEGAFRLDDEGRLVNAEQGLVFREVDREAGAEWSALTGRWRLDGWGPHVEVNGFVVTVGSCAVTSSPGSMLLTGWPANPFDCLGTSAPRSAKLLVELLSASDEPPVGHVLDGRLVITGSQAAVQLVKVEPVAAPGSIGMETGAAFGLVPGSVVTVDDELTRLEGLLGRVHHDTDWYSVPVTTYEDGTEDCLGGRTYRVLWWGDLSLAFWRDDDGEESLWAWSVGDPRVSLWGDRRESYRPPTGASSGVRTETGIGIGTAEAELVTTYGDRLTKFDPSAEDFGGQVYDSSGQGWPLANSGSVGSTFLVRDGAVVGFGSSLRFC